MTDKRNPRYYVATIDGKESAPMPLKLLRNRLIAVQDDASEISIHTYPEGKLYELIKPTKLTKRAAKGGRQKMSARRLNDKDCARRSSQTRSRTKNEARTVTDAVIALAQRKQGATAAELNALTNWKGAPWKWLFSNSKKTGWCDKRNLKFKVLKRQGAKRTQVVYKVASATNTHSTSRSKHM